MPHLVDARQVDRQRLRASFPPDPEGGASPPPPFPLSLSYGLLYLLGESQVERPSAFVRQISWKSANSTETNGTHKQIDWI
jgi:hypothetical protein